MLDKYIKDVTEFRKMFGLPVNEPMKDFDLDLHLSLAIEELTELADSRNAIDAMDAIVDTVYVLVGQCVHVGYELNEIEFMIGILKGVAARKKWNFEKCWDEVHRSNMSKLCDTREDAMNTVNFYKEFKDQDSEIQPRGNKFAVVATSGQVGKVLKSISYSPANLTNKVTNHENI